MNIYITKEAGTGHNITYRLFLIIMYVCILSLVGYATCFASTVVLQWDANTDAGLNGYKVYYQADTSVQPFTGTGATQGPSPLLFDKTLTSATISGLDPAHSYYFAVTAYDTTGTESSYSNIVYVPELVSPTISITSPTNNASVSGTVTVTASASDNVGVSRVEFFINDDTAPFYTDNVPPYTFNWNTTSSGSYTLSAKAYDAAGNVGQSNQVAVTVNNSPPPGSYTAIFGNVTGANYPNTVQDTFINLNYEVNATNTILNTYTWPANTPANAILMKLDVSAIPADAQIQSAILYLNLLNSVGDALYEIPASEIINKQPVIASSNGYTYDGTNAWTPSSIPYGGIPLAQSDVGPVVDAPLVDKINGYKSWNVTNAVKDWVANPDNNYGLILNSSSKASADSSRIFASSEAVDANQRPKLVVSYLTGAVSDTIAPVLSIGVRKANISASGIVSVAVSANDNVGVSRVEFYVNGVVASSATIAPYVFNWDSTVAANGSNTLMARAYDAAGNIGQSASIKIAVPNVKFR